MSAVCVGGGDMSCMHNEGSGGRIPHEIGEEDVRLHTGLSRDLPDKVVIEANGIVEIWASSITRKSCFLTTAKLYTYLHLAENVMATVWLADTEEYATCFKNCSQCLV